MFNRMTQHFFHFTLGLLGFGQEVGSAQTLPVCQLADLLLEVHARARRLLRQELPGLRSAQNKGQRDLAGGGGPLGNCPGNDDFFFALLIYSFVEVF